MTVFDLWRNYSRDMYFYDWAESELHGNLAITGNLYLLEPNIWKQNLPATTSISAGEMIIALIAAGNQKRDMLFNMQETN